MIINKNIDKICVAVIIIAVMLTTIFINGVKLGITPVIDMDSEAYDGPEYVTANDLDGSYSAEGATLITLQGSTAKINGTGAYVNGSDVVISNGGYYLLEGKLEGRIIVDAYASSKVWIVFNGVTINCEDDAAVRVEQADKVFLTLAKDSINEVSGGEIYSDAAVEDGAEAVIFSHDDLTINGSGKLSVTALYKHGIKANDDLVVAGGEIYIEAAEDAIHVNEDVAVVNASLTIDAGDDAITTDGTINAENSQILINSCYEGLEAAYINIYSGDISIYPEDDGFNATDGTATGFGGMAGGFGGPGRDGETDSESDDSSDISAENTELPYIKIYDGNIKIINSSARDADGLDSNGDIYIYGGNVFISLQNSGTNNAIDYGSESGGKCVVEGGTVVACGSYNMAEGFDSSSTQASFMYTIGEGVEAGSIISVESIDEEELISVQIPCSFSCAIISTPDLLVGNDYLVALGDEVDDISIDEISSSFGDAKSSMFGGTMNFGGMQSRNSFREGRMSGVSVNGIGGGDRPGGKPEGKMGMPSQEQGMQPQEQGMPPEEQGMSPEEQGMQPQEQGMQPQEQGMQPQEQGMPSQDQEMRPGDGVSETMDSSASYDGKALSEYDIYTWLYFLASILILGAGLKYVISFRRR
ncbi:MAG: carbohydrate-binding domain-containing protein [Lachnospiraceae bacterium]|nr:carbohydrate-binding domain-containing protein [Lachnospiraceae bacterium]